MKKLLRRTAIVLGIILALAVLRIVVGRLAGPMLLENARARFEAEVGPLRPELADATVAPEDNAGPLLLEAAAVFDLSGDDRELLSAIGDDPATATDPKLQEQLRIVVETNLESLALVDRAGERPDSLMQRRRDTFLGENDLPNAIIHLLNVSKLIRAVGRVAIAEGDDEAFLLSIERLATLARALRQERIMVAGIVSDPIEGYLHDLVRHRVQDPVPPEVAARLGLALTTIEEAPPFRDILAAECSVADTLYPEMFLTGESSWAKALEPLDENHFRAANLLSYADLAALLEQPREQWPELREPTRMQVLRGWVDPFSTPTVLRSILAPNLRDVVERAQELQAEHALARTALGYLSGESSSGTDSVAYTGESIQRRTLDDGTLELSLPAAAERLRAEAGSYSDPDSTPRRVLEQQAERMTWKVAPPVELTAPGDPTAI